MNSMYNGFAYMYDLLMKDVPYEIWADYIDSVLVQHLGENRHRHIVVDLACGTGNITFPLARKGWDMIGVDISADMLSQAQTKIDDEKILFLAQDMRELDLYGTVDAVVCACDGLNYILDEVELGFVFSRVKMFLNPGGVFIFDMNTEYKFKEIMGGKTFTAPGYEWDNTYDLETGINKYHVIFTPDDSEPFEEVHYQRGYSNGLVQKLLHDAGFDLIDIKDNYNDSPPKDNCTRMVYIAVAKP